MIEVEAPHPEHAAGVAAWHYDGRTAQRRSVHLTLSGSLLLIAETGESIPLDLLRPAGDRTLLSYRHRDIAGWRIDPIGPLPPAWQGVFPAQEHHGGLMDRWGVKRTSALAAILGAIGIAAFGWGTALLAQMIPLRWEIAMGALLSGQFPNGTCVGPAGRTAVDRLDTELASGTAPIRITVVDLPIVNAVALPGRQIILFRGLIDQAASPDEVAGVLAHEIGHVERRDPLTALLRGYGLSLLLGGVDGGALMQALMANRYSRSQERGADAAALAALARAHISPRPMAAFFDRLSHDETLGQGAAVFLSTHPLSTERRDIFLKAAIPATPRPSLSASDWEALRAICGATPDRGGSNRGHDR